MNKKQLKYVGYGVAAIAVVAIVLHLKKKSDQKKAVEAAKVKELAKAETVDSSPMTKAEMPPLAINLLVE